MQYPPFTSKIMMPGCVTDRNWSITKTLSIGARNGRLRDSWIFEKVCPLVSDYPNKKWRSKFRSKQNYPLTIGNGYCVLSNNRYLFHRLENTFSRLHVFKSSPQGVATPIRRTIFSLITYLNFHFFVWTCYSLLILSLSLLTFFETSQSYINQRYHI